LAVSGDSVTADKTFNSYFENTAEKIITIRVASSANGAIPRTLKVVPIASEIAVRNRDWVEGNRQFHCS